MEDGEGFEGYFLKIEKITVGGLTSDIGEGGINKLDDPLELNMYSFHRI